MEAAPSGDIWYIWYSTTRVKKITFWGEFKETVSWIGTSAKVQFTLYSSFSPCKCSFEVAHILTNLKVSSLLVWFGGIKLVSLWQFWTIFSPNLSISCTVWLPKKKGLTDGGNSWSAFLPLLPLALRFVGGICSMSLLKIVKIQNLPLMGCLKILTIVNR